MSKQQKLEAAINWLGERYVLHASRRVTKLHQAAQQDIHKADVAATFKRIRKQLAADQTAVPN